MQGTGGAQWDQARGTVPGGKDKGLSEGEGNEGGEGSMDSEKSQRKHEGRFLMEEAESYRGRLGKS